MERVLFAWVHLSDIHFGHGDASHGWDQVLVLGALRADLRERRHFGAPAPDALLLTGDIAFSGNRRIRSSDEAAHEYQDAGNWLGELAGDLGVAKERVFMVPGNHDVQREGKGDSKRKRLLDRLRSDGDLDAALDSAAERALLEQRLASYRAFASGFAPTPGLWWTNRQTCRGGLKLRLVGLNTALLAADDQDRGRLRLGKQQRACTFMEPPLDRDELAIVLSHHPFAAGWLADEREVTAFAGKYAAIHLSGHLHDADAQQVVRSDGAGLVRVSAGAAHDEKQASGIPASHGYNISGIVSSGGGLKLRVWPRRWSEKNGGFVVDSDNVRDGRPFAEHDLTRFADFIPLRPPREVVLFTATCDPALAIPVREAGHFAFLPEAGAGDAGLGQATVVVGTGRDQALDAVRGRAGAGARVITLGRDSSADELFAQLDSGTCEDRQVASPLGVVFACDGDATAARGAERALGAPASPLGEGRGEALRQALADGRQIVVVWSARAAGDATFLATLQTELLAPLGVGARRIQVVRLDDTPLQSLLAGLDEVNTLASLRPGRPTAPAPVSNRAHPAGKPALVKRPALARRYAGVLQHQRRLLLLAPSGGGARTMVSEVCEQLGFAAERMTCLSPWTVPACSSREYFAELTRDPSVASATDYQRWQEARAGGRPHLIVVRHDGGPQQHLQDLAMALRSLWEGRGEQYLMLVAGGGRAAALRFQPTATSLLSGMPTEHLPPLEVAEVATILVGSGEDPGAAAAFWQLTDGHPGFIRELLSTPGPLVGAEAEARLARSGPVRATLNRRLAEDDNDRRGTFHAAQVLEGFLTNGGAAPPSRLLAEVQDDLRFGEVRLYYDAMVREGPDGKPVLRGEAVWRAARLALETWKETQA